MLTGFPELALDLTFRPVANDHPVHFTRAQIDAYNRAGYVTGIPLFDGSRLAGIQEFFARSKERLTPTGPVFEAFHHEVPDLYDVVTDARLTDHLVDLLGPDVVCHTSQFIRKEPGEMFDVRWHQDSSYNPMDARCVVVWIAIEDADVENGCMWFIPGSHTLGQLDFDEKDGHRVAEAERCGPETPIELKAGHAVFFSDLLLHRSPGNRSPLRARPGLTATYNSASVRMHRDKGRWAVLCRGRDTAGLWKLHPRPGGAA
ncbi:MAG: phytanoyl-CoA dioxygenase family protein [Planctomycetes bacterium]|nr:phytanoyl-CoA dioxygenase family protein [Planctomycetota bacterium]